MNSQSDQPEQPHFDKLTGVFCAAASHISAAILTGKEIRTRSAILVSACGVTLNLLRTMQPSDVSELADLNFELTKYLDRIVLNSEPDDPHFAELRKYAEDCVTWPTLVRSGDKKFTDFKLEKLGVGSRAALPVSKRASLKTDANRLTLRLVEELKNSAESVLNIKRNDVLGRSTLKEQRTALEFTTPRLPKEKRTEFLRILRRVEHARSAEDQLNEWSGILADYILFADPEFKRFPELRAVTTWKRSQLVMDSSSSLRSQLQKFFRTPLKTFLGQ